MHGGCSGAAVQPVQSSGLVDNGRCYLLACNYLPLVFVFVFVFVRLRLLLLLTITTTTSNTSNATYYDYYCTPTPTTIITTNPLLPLLTTTATTTTTTTITTSNLLCFYPLFSLLSPTRIRSSSPTTAFPAQYHLSVCSICADVDVNLPTSTHSRAQQPG